MLKSEVHMVLLATLGESRPNRTSLDEFQPAAVLHNFRGDAQNMHVIQARYQE